MNKVIYIFLLLFAIYSTFASDNLFRNAIFTGSSFSGISTGIKVSNDYYFDKLNDGNLETFYLPMDRQGPYYLEGVFRTAVYANTFKYYGNRINNITISIDNQGKWEKISSAKGNSKTVTFPTVKSRKFRIDFGLNQSIMQIFELELYGPKQPIVPKKLPQIKGQKILFEVKSFESKVKNNVVSGKIKVIKKTNSNEDCYFFLHLADFTHKKFKKWANNIDVCSETLRPKISTKNWKINKEYEVNFSFILPEYAPKGNINLEILSFSMDGKKQFLTKFEDNLHIKNQLAPEVKVFSKRIVSKISDRNGQKTFEIDGKCVQPFFMRYMRQMDYQRLFYANKNEIDINYFLIYYSCIGNKNEYYLYFERLEQQILSTLKINPNALFFVGLDLRASTQYRIDNPSELMLNNDMQIIKEKRNPYGLISFGSEKYYYDTIEFIDMFFEFLENKSYKNRIIGYQPWTNTTNDAFIGGIDSNRFEKDRSKLKVGDYHPGVLKKFRNFLRNKYKINSNLQKIYQDNSICFDTVKIPYHMAEEEVSKQVFRNPAKNQNLSDYFEFFPTLIGSFTQKLARHIKKKTEYKSLVFVHYGAILSTLANAQPGGNRQHGTNNDFKFLLADKNIDMFVQAFSYQYRHSGEVLASYHLTDSLTLHDKMYFADYDARTFTTDWLVYGRHRGEKETTALLYRDLGFLLLKNGGAWLSDMAQSSPDNFSGDSNSWFSAPAISKIIKNVNQIFSKAYEKAPKKSVAEIAVWVGVNSVKYEDTLNAAIIYRNLIGNTLNLGLNKLGAPYDIYLLSDIDNPKLKKDYKLHIFLNAFAISNKERKAIEKLKSNNNTLLWFYAPDYLNNKKGFDLEQMQKTIGMQIAQSNYNKTMQTTIKTTLAPFKKNNNLVLKATTYGGIAAILHPSDIKPQFKIIDLNAIALGVGANGEVNFALKEFDSFSSIYCATAYLSVEVLRSIAEYAKVHLYTNKAAVMMADNKFLIINNGYAQEETYTIKLPRKETIIDVLNKKVLCNDATQFNITLETPSTYILKRKESKK